VGEEGRAGGGAAGRTQIRDDRRRPSPRSGIRCAERSRPVGQECRGAAPVEVQSQPRRGAVQELRGSERTADAASSARAWPNTSPSLRAVCLLVCELYRLTHHVRASRVADDSNAPLSVPHAHAEHQREVRVVQHHLVCARCAHGIGDKSGACSITTHMNMSMRCPPPPPPPSPHSPPGMAPPASLHQSAAAARSTLRRAAGR
jgi:hypothetical protein